MYFQFTKELEKWKYPFVSEQTIVLMSCPDLTLVIQPWLSDEDDEPPFSPVLRKKAVKVKHVKRREKKFDKKVRKILIHFW